MKPRTRNIIAILGGGFVLAMAFAIMMYNKPHTDLNSKKADHQLTAAELFAAFEGDEAAATEKFTSREGKEIVIEVSGTAQEVNTTSGGGMTVMLKEEGDMFGVNCEFLEKAEVKSGDKIVVRGFCTGMLMDVVISRCVLVGK